MQEEGESRLRIRLSNGLEVNVTVNLETDSVKDLKEKIGSAIKI